MVGEFSASQRKRDLRAEIARRIAALGEEERATGSRAVARRLLALPEFRRALAVMLFAGMPDEVDTAPVIAAALEAGKRVGLPRCRPGTREIEVVEVRDPERDLAPGTYDIREPVGASLIAPEDLDLVVVPGRAFDRRGNRLGRGAGYYDRFLAGAASRAVRVALCFHCQLVEDVPAGDTDVPVDIVVTDRELVRTG